LDAIAEAGFSGAGLMTTKAPNRLVLSVATSMKEAEQIGEELKRRKLRGLSAYVGSLPKTVEAGTDALRGLIDKAVAAGVGSLLMGGVGDAAAAEAYYGAIARCCDYAAEHRIEIALKPHGGLNATGPQCRKTIESIHHPAFRLWYDPGNIFYYSDGKRDPVEDSATVDGLVTGMCVKDFRPPKDVDVTPGTGRVDFHGVLSRLRQGGFRGGPLVVETLAPGNRSETLEQAKQARMFLEKLIREL
jgi:sugar phosphate isomerase/epimerase